MFGLDAAVLALAAVAVPMLDGESFDPAAAVRAVNRLLAAGPAAALDALRSRARDATTGPEQGDVLVLCRLAFDPAPGAVLPPLLAGVPDVVVPEDAEAEWPRFPLALVDDVPFLLVRGYLVGGLAEPPAEHVERCTRAGQLRTRPLSPAPPLAAVAALLGSDAWERLAAANGGAGETAEMLRRQARRAEPPGPDQGRSA